MTRDDLIDLMARAMVGDERYEAMPESASYLERKSMPSFAEWTDRADTRETAEHILAAITNAGYAVVPESATTAQLTAGQTAWLNDPCRRSSTLYRAMVEAGRIDKEANSDAR